MMVQSVGLPGGDIMKETLLLLRRQKKMMSCRSSREEELGSRVIHQAGCLPCTGDLDSIHGPKCGSLCPNRSDT